MIKKIISGGQTGVDRAALDVGLELSIPIGGWCPKGRKAEDGPIDEKYPLVETYEAEYPPRTKLNILTADATLIIIQNESELDQGTLLTQNLCKKYAQINGKLWGLVILPPVHLMYAKILQTRRAINNIETLNVAGPRESKSPGIYEAVKKFLLEVLK